MDDCSTASSLWVGREAKPLGGNRDCVCLAVMVAWTHKGLLSPANVGSSRVRAAVVQSLKPCCNSALSSSTSPDDPKQLLEFPLVTLDFQEEREEGLKRQSGM